MRAGVPNPLGVIRLARWLRQDPPDLIQTWMYHADLIGGIAAKLAGGIPVAWNIRHSDLDAQGNKRSTLLDDQSMCWVVQWLPTRIVCCAESLAEVHTEFGYAGSDVVIPNGFDLDGLQTGPVRTAICAPRARHRQRGLDHRLGRSLHPQKDHGNLLGRCPAPRRISGDPLLTLRRRCNA